MDFNIDVAVINQYINDKFPSNTYFEMLRRRSGQKLVYRVCLPQGGDIIVKMILIGDGYEVDELMAKRAERELRVLNACTVSGIVKLDNRQPAERVELGGYTFIVYGEEPLLDLDKSKYKGNLEESIELLKDVFNTLKYLHENKQIIHRDIKPQNIMIHPVTQRHTLIDFGLVGLDGASVITRGSAGTLPYMSPEQIRDTHLIDHRSDMFSCGITIYELYAGVYPFAETRNIVQAILTESINFGNEFEDVDKWILYLKRLTNKSPHQRFRNYDIAIEELNKLL